MEYTLFLEQPILPCHCSGLTCNVSTNEALNVHCNRAALLESTGLPEVNFFVNLHNSLQFSIKIEKKVCVYQKYPFFYVFEYSECCLIQR